MNVEFNSKYWEFYATGDPNGFHIFVRLKGTGYDSGNAPLHLTLYPNGKKQWIKGERKTQY